jgi:hypothetical protein
MKFLLALFVMFLPVSSQAQELTYFPPGNILPKTVTGVNSREVAFPNWVFPMNIGSTTGRHAYIGTQLGKYHGLDWSNDPRLFAYPHRDNQCEPRRWAVNACPASKGHQGVDIRAHDRTDNKWDVVAVEGGIVTKVTSNTTVVVRNGTRSVRYLHMHPESISAAGIKKGARVSQGQTLGRVSCYMGGKCQTSQHLHFDAHAGVSSSGNFYHVYPSLIAAYRRAWGLDDGIQNGVLKRDTKREIDVPASEGGFVPRPEVPNTERCKNVSVTAPLNSVDSSSLSSLWLHNCSVVGLVSDSKAGTRSFVYYQPKTSIFELVRNDPILFKGSTSGGHYSGHAKTYSTKCGALSFAVSGPVQDHAGVPVVAVAGLRPRRDSKCNQISSKNETLVFKYLGKVGNAAVPKPPALPANPDRTTLSETTRNFLAITFYPDEDGKINLLPYVAHYPGLSEDQGKLDSKGGLIPTMKTDEAGVGISWVWIQRRARFVDALSTSPRQIAHSMAGVDPSVCGSDVRPTSAALRNLGEDKAMRYCRSVSAYLRGYVGFANGRNFAADYFGRDVGVDETLNLAQPDVAFAWMRTMYSHESGKPAIISKEVFARGQRLGNDWISEHYMGKLGSVKDMAYYGDPCNFGAQLCKGESGNEDDTVATNSSELSIDTLQDAIRELEKRVAELEKEK